MPEAGPGQVDLGIVVVTYDGADVIAGCLESLMAARASWPGRLRVVVVDNASGDETVAVIRGWAAGQQAVPLPGNLPFAVAPVPRPLRLAEGSPDLLPDPAADVVLLHSGANRGFAGGVNVGLAHLARDPAVGHFWVLNPDTMVPADAVAALAGFLAPAPAYGLLGGRVIYLEHPDRIQIEGGLLNRWTGITSNYNFGLPVSSPRPRAEDLDFIMGANLVASRAFYEATGPMREDYFLYYEEVDWAMRRGDLPLAYCPGFDVYHWGGTAIGSPVIGRLKASPFSLYFKHRARLRFQRRFHPWALPVAWAFSLAQAARMGILWRGPEEARAILAGSFGLPAPRAVRDRLRPDAMPYAFSRPARPARA